VEIIDQSVNYYYGWTIINGHVASLPACWRISYTSLGL